MSDLRTLQGVQAKPPAKNCRTVSSAERTQYESQNLGSTWKLANKAVVRPWKLEAERKGPRASKPDQDMLAALTNIQLSNLLPHLPSSQRQAMLLVHSQTLWQLKSRVNAAANKQWSNSSFRNRLLKVRSRWLASGRIAQVLQHMWLHFKSKCELFAIK